MIYDYLLNTISAKGAAYLILLDPERISKDKLFPFIRHCEKCGVDGFLVGGSLILDGDFESFIEKVKETTNLPAIIFPGGVEQVFEAADAILFLSVVSGRNPEHLIGKQVLAAPVIKKKKLEPIPTGYMIIESGSLTTAEYFSNSLPIPRNKPDIAAATALAAEYLGDLHDLRPALARGLHLHEHQFALYELATGEVDHLYDVDELVKLLVDLLDDRVVADRHYCHF